MDDTLHPVIALKELYLFGTPQITVSELKHLEAVIRLVMLPLTGVDAIMASNSLQRLIGRAVWHFGGNFYGGLYV